VPRGHPGRVAASCHPHRFVNAYIADEGLCVVCYRRYRYQNEPEYRARKQAESREAMRWKGSGWTRESYDEAVLRQGGCCAICGDADPNLAADHDHATGLPRALLCSRCNTGLGLFRDTPANLSAAIRYLEAYGREGS
jgi:5-methylcytosine-specific restriction endonuclease McrA